MTPIKYIDSFSDQNNNIVVFISKLSELTNISLPCNIEIDLNNKSFQEILTKKSYIELLKTTNNNLTYKIIIKIFYPRKDNFVLIGSQIYNYFDYIVEYTFYCAIPPERRKKYIDVIYELLKNSGELVGIFLPLATYNTPVLSVR